MGRKASCMSSGTQYPAPFPLSAMLMYIGGWLPLRKSSGGDNGCCGQFQCCLFLAQSPQFSNFEQ